MSRIFDLLFVATDALLWPVLLGLFAMVAYSLYSLGAVFREGLSRDDTLRRRLAELAGLSAADRVAAVQGAELRFARTVDRAAMVSRLGPMFGLAGTLIPLGPGLRQLHEGNLGGLGEQLAVAFATTVAGLFVCAICYSVAGLRGRWYEQQLRALEQTAGSLGRE